LLRRSVTVGCIVIVHARFHYSTYCSIVDGERLICFVNSILVVGTLTVSVVALLVRLPLHPLWVANLKYHCSIGQREGIGRSYCAWFAQCKIRTLLLLLLSRTGVIPVTVGASMLSLSFPVLRLPLLMVNVSSAVQHLEVVGTLTVPVPLL
jgi:hypothetical protein